MRKMKYTEQSAVAAAAWQREVRNRLLRLLKLEDLLETRHQIAFNTEEINSVTQNGYVSKEVEFNSTRERRILALITLPSKLREAQPAVVCIHGHSDNRKSVYVKDSIYKGFASELAAKNYVTIAVNVGQHKVQENDRTLMGERLWDLMRCVDYLLTLPEADSSRIGCAGLSLGGEMAMWLGATDERILATASSGFLTRMDQMENNHCMCWKFDGLRDLVDFSDIYSLIAPRALLCQNGSEEPSIGFPPAIAREALADIQKTYLNFGKPGNVSLEVHNGAHEVELQSLLDFLEKHLKHYKASGHGK